MNTNRTHENAGEGGYSLAEMLTVLALIGMATMTVLPLITGTVTRHRVIDYSDQVENTFQYMRMKAISERTDYVVQFTEDGLNAFPDRNSNGTRDADEGWAMAAPLRLPPNIEFSYPAGAGATAAANSLTAAGCKCVIFQPSGCIQNLLPDSNMRSLAIGDGKEYRQVSVSEGGAVAIQKWNCGKNEWR